MYIHQHKNWPKFYWDIETVSAKLIAVRHHQGILLGRMGALGFSLRDEAMLETLTVDVLKSNEIEGEILNHEQVRSSIARRLGMDIGGLIASDRHVEGVVEMMLDATQHFDNELSEERLYSWHASLFPTGRSGLYKIMVGNWRTSTHEPMQVVSGGIGREKIHFEAPNAELLPQEMAKYTEWFNAENNIDPVIKAAIAHLWFLTIHPFDDGNGRIARTIADMQLARADGSTYRFYSMSAQILIERNAYYDILEKTQKHTLDITQWLMWFLECFERALQTTENTLAIVLKKGRFWDALSRNTFNDRQYKMINKLLDGFDGKLFSSKWATINKCSQDTALRDIQDLMNKGILIKESSGGRSTSYILRPTI